MQTKWPLLIIILGSLTFFIFCQSNKEIVNSGPTYLGLNDTVAYVGMQQCRSCHEDVYKTFIETGMGQSFGHATPQKSSASFDQHSTVYDSISNYYYQPFWKGDSLFIKEFRLLGQDTTHQLTQSVKYIIGSGHHTNSHIYEHNGYLFQAPITFYTQDKKWDLAPGFEGGFSSRFNRIIGNECMSCHNMYPNFIEGSENKFLSVPQGIECERCHGPGEAHVKAKLASEIIDTSQYIDYSIVNPSKLERELQLNVCQRCHMQGVSVLKDGKDYHDFKPGMPLTDVMDIFLPNFSGGETKFIMASQAHRMEKSECFKKSDMTCISCHNPHISTKVTPRATFNNACIKCHEAPKSICTIPETKRIAENKNDCSGCHMPTSGSIDIPNVTITDHFIRKPLTEAQKAEVENFIGLACTTNDTPDPLIVAQGHLNYFEQFSNNPMLLDSAAYYLSKAKTRSRRGTRTKVHLHFLKDEYEAIRTLAKDFDPKGVKDGWTAYRIGESFYQATDYKKAYAFFQQAINLEPLHLDFLNKLGSAAMQVGELKEAKRVFELIVSENDRHIAGLNNLGFVNLNFGNVEKAEELYQKALALNPDYEPALLNLVGFHLVKKDKRAAQKVLKKILQLNPNQPKAKQLLQQLKGI